MSNITLHKGEAFSHLLELPHSHFNAVITDPPYASGGASSSARQADPTKKYQSSGTKKQYPSFANDSRDQRSHFLWTLEWMMRAYNVTADHGWLMCFTDWRQLPITTDAVQAAGWTWKGILPWDKTEQCRPARGSFRNQCEYVVFAVKGKYDPEVKTVVPGVCRTPMFSKDKLHLTAKPVELMEHLMRVLPPNSKILDPFAGSGTTLLAARNRGHDAHGIELSPEYYEIACDRLDLPY